MGNQHFYPTPEQAREQLATSAGQLTASSRDRTVHAATTAVVGLDSGFFVATQNVAHGTAEVVLTLTFVLVWLGAVCWSERVSRTVPRRARRWSVYGMVGSFALALFAVLPWLNLQAQDSPNTWAMALVAAVIVAIPSLLAAAVIGLRRR